MWCTCVYPHVYAGVLTGACTRGGQMSTSGLILSHSPTLFLRQDFPLNRKPTIWLACKSLGSAYLYLTRD